MSKLNAAYVRAASRPSRLTCLRQRAERDWVALRPSAVVVAVFAGIVLLDGLLTIGLFALLEALGLHEPVVDPSAVPLETGLAFERIPTGSRSV